MDTSSLECVLNEQLYQIGNEIHFLENNNLEYHKKIEENSKKIEELKKLLQEKEATIKKILEEKELELKKKFEETQSQEQIYYVTAEIRAKADYKNQYDNFCPHAASTRYEEISASASALIFAVDEEGQTDKLPPKKSKWEF